MNINNAGRRRDKVGSTSRHGKATNRLLQFEQSLDNTLLLPRPWTSAFWGCCFIIYFLFILFIVNPALRYSTINPEFLTTYWFFSDFLNLPGGILEYLAAFLNQFLQFQWIGAFVITFLTFAVCACALFILRKFTGNWHSFAALIPAYFLAVAQDSYSYPLMITLVTLLSALAFSALYLSINFENMILRIITFLILLLILYFIAAGNIFLFVAICGLYELLIKRNYMVFTVFLCASIIIPLMAKEYYYAMHIHDAYTGLIPFYHFERYEYISLGLYLFIPVFLLVSYLLRRYSIISTLRRKYHLFSRSFIKPPLLKYYIFSALVILLFFMFDFQHKRLAEVTHYARTEQWDNVLDSADALDSFDPATYTDVIHALYHRDTLLFTAFKYPLYNKYQLWLGFREGIPIDRALKISGLLFEMGQINKAERMASEAMELNGYTADILKKLVLINILKHEFNTARQFMNILSKTLFNDAWTSEYSTLISNNKSINDFPELERIHALRIKTDYVGNYENEAILDQCLDANSGNKMAFEYLILHYLIKRDLGSIYNHLFMFDTLEYDGLPAHVAEAMLLLQKMRDGVSLEQYNISKTTESRFTEFHNKFMSYRGDLEKAAAGLASKFGDTYFYFYMFGSTP
ncbi:MAG: DUF6057 family protein [Verrucomicrobia bacterium]|nr:DUF6057 family protein [Verrucomicrobiota bacterium]